MKCSFCKEDLVYKTREHQNEPLILIHKSTYSMFCSDIKNRVISSKEETKLLHTVHSEKGDEKLSNCPFCGNSLCYFKGFVKNENYSDSGVRVCCSNCGAGTRYTGDMEEAAKLWNKRSNSRGIISRVLLFLIRLKNTLSSTTIMLFTFGGYCAFTAGRMWEGNDGKAVFLFLLSMAYLVGGFVFGYYAYETKYGIKNDK